MYFSDRVDAPRKGRTEIYARDLLCSAKSLVAKTRIDTNMLC